jgi:murein L,D-transpeptidase YcbB/YkuD
MIKCHSKIVFLALFFLFVKPLTLQAQGLLDKVFGDKDTIHPQYKLLQDRLTRYESISQGGGWASVPTAKDSVRAGKRNSTVLLLRQRLEEEGYLRKRLLFRSDTFDTELTEALKSFQKNYGVPSTGFLNPATITALNVPAGKRAEQMKLNMERWKLMPGAPSRHILVNIPDFKMEVIESCSVTLSMKVVVGKIDRPTPVFSSTLTYIVLNPTWNVPQNILKKDVLPKVKKDRAYLVKNGMKIYKMDNSGQRTEVSADSIDWKKVSLDHFPYEIIEDPGPLNSLGVVKFMFPNTYSVYMHDSPAKKLFKSEEPVFSSGCVRLSNAMALAAHLLAKEKNWEKDKLLEALATGETQTIILKNPIPVFIQYFTSWVDDSGAVQFRKDIYHLDDLKNK